MNNSKSLANLVTAAIFAAITTIFIWFVKIPIPSTSGYVHLGDSVIYLAAYLLPLPYALGAAAVGGLLADLFVGAAVYAVPTAIIKALMAFCAARSFSAIKNKNASMALAFGLGSIVLVLGYFLYELVIWGAAYAAAGVIWNIAQGVCAGIITVPMIHIAKRFRPGGK